MKHLKTYTQYNSDFPIIESNDVDNFNLIFSSMYNYHLSINERVVIESDFGIINESWYSELADKGKRGVLAVKTKAGELLVDLAKKAKDVLDFAKQLAGKIGEYIKGQFSGLSDKVKSYAMKDTGFGQVLLEFIEKKKIVKLKTYITVTVEILQYISSGRMITDLINRLSECFSKVLNLGTNEGLNYLESDFLNEELFGFGKKKSEDEGGDKKPFLQRLGEKIMTFPPFSWIPKIEDMMKKGISFLANIIDRFFGWLMNGVDGGSKFLKGFIFLFQMLEIYVYYKVVGKIEEFKAFLKKASGLEDLTSQIKDKSLEQVWSTIGFNGAEIVSNVKKAIMKIPYVGDILSILDGLVVAIGTYLAVEPTIKRLIS
jgi:hypothetical protein